MRVHVHGNGLVLDPLESSQCWDGSSPALWLVELDLYLTCFCLFGSVMKIYCCYKV